MMWEKAVYTAERPSIIDRVGILLLLEIMNKFKILSVAILRSGTKSFMLVVK